MVWSEFQAAKAKGIEVEPAQATRTEYNALVASKALYFIVDTIAGRVWRSVESGGLGRWNGVPPTQLRVLVDLIMSGKGATASSLGVTDGTVENARRLIEKPPAKRFGWRALKTVRGSGEEPNKFCFDPEPELRWCLILPADAESQVSPADAESQEPRARRRAAVPGVRLSADRADYMLGDGNVLVSETTVMSLAPTTVIKIELIASTKKGRKVLVAGRPSGRYEVPGGWLWPTRRRLRASDGISGALEFPAWTYGIRDKDIVEGPATLVAVLGDGTRVDAKIALRRVAV